MLRTFALSTQLLLALCLGSLELLLLHHLAAAHSEARVEPEALCSPANQEQLLNAAVRKQHFICSDIAATEQKKPKKQKNPKHTNVMQITAQKQRLRVAMV